MKKILPYIFILLIITSILAPFGVEVGKGRQVAIRTNIARAWDFCLSATTNNTYQSHKDTTTGKEVCNKSKIIVSGVETEVQDRNISTDPLPKGTTISPSSLPQCLGWFGVSLAGCIGQLIYYAVFIPTSYLFALAGRFFDWTFFYSISDNSYRSEFVVEGWGIVRDFVNMFFIFVLLYVAFSTILGLHGAKPKEMIINVVIIGILINFSLFATQVIIDTSNILARVFYNSSSIKITQESANGVTNATPGLVPGLNGEVPLSAAIVNKVNPQELIIHASRVSDVKDSAGKAESTESISAVTFILVALLAIGVNIIGIIVFLSTGIIFISRVIGLWMACIFVPFAFFSYTVPALEGIEMIGWKHWWPDTLKQAFLAPVFIFFLYLILRFLEKGLSLVQTTNSNDGIAFVISIVVPFAFIMMLMWKAKSIAGKMSGEMGQAITKGLSMAGGLALGAATGGVAMLGSKTIGRFANKVNNSSTLNDYASGKKGNFVTQKLATFGKGAASSTAKSSFDLRQTAGGNALSKGLGMDLSRGTAMLGLGTGATLGGYAGIETRKIDKENKFADSLGYDHHAYEYKEEEISGKEDTLRKFKRDPKLDINDPEFATQVKEKQDKINAQTAKIGTMSRTGDEGKQRDELIKKTYEESQELEKFKKNPVLDRNSSAYKGEVEKQEQDIAGEKKNLERIKTSRAKEYALTEKRRSGKIYDIDKHKDLNDPEYKKYRDDNGNIKRYGHASDEKGRAATRLVIEALMGAAKGAAAGAIAGSVIPVFGTMAGAIGGGFAGAIKQALLDHNGDTNRKVGDSGHEKVDAKDNYHAPTPPAPVAHAAPSGGSAANAPAH